MVIVDAAPARSSARRWNAPICVNSRVLLLAGVLAVQDHDLDLSMSFADLTWGRGARGSPRRERLDCFPRPISTATPDDPDRTGVSRAVRPLT